MKAIVVYESVFGNTEQVARAIGKAYAHEEGSGTYHTDQIRPDQLKGADILILGSPTQKFQAMPGAKKFIRKIPSGGLKGIKIATFDTRVSTEDIKSGFLRFLLNLFGYAAKPLANRLKRKGGELISPPEGFYVKDTKGPLKDGELERAEEWGNQLKSLAKEKKQQANV